MERDDSREREPPTNADAKSLGEVIDEHREDRPGVADSSGYTTTKQAAKVLGVSRRTVQSYVRRGELEAVVEGEGVEKTFYVSIDSLNALRERRRLRRMVSSRFAEPSPNASAYSEVSAKPTQGLGEVAPDLIEVMQDLQYRLGRAEAQVELTEKTESTLREQLAREQERADRLEAELREARKPSPAPQDAPEPAVEDASGTEPPASDTSRSRSWWRRLFGG